MSELTARNVLLSRRIVYGRPLDAADLSELPMQSAALRLLLDQDGPAFARVRARIRAGERLPRTELAQWCEVALGPELGRLAAQITAEASAGLRPAKGLENPRERLEVRELSSAERADEAEAVGTARAAELKRLAAKVAEEVRHREMRSERVRAAALVSELASRRESLMPPAPPPLSAEPQADHSLGAASEERERAGARVHRPGSHGEAKQRPVPPLPAAEPLVFRARRRLPLETLIGRQVEWNADLFKPGKKGVRRGEVVRVVGDELVVKWRNRVMHFDESTVGGVLRVVQRPHPSGRWAPPADAARFGRPTISDNFETTGTTGDTDYR